MMTLILTILSSGFLFTNATAETAATNFKPAAVYQELVPSFRKTLGELVAADTTNPPGNEARAVKILAKRLDAAGVKYQIDEFAPGRQSIVARLKGDGTQRPLMLLAHIDVVGTDNQTWTMPKHKLTEKDGYYYGRGVNDDLGMAVANLEVFLLLKKNKTALHRDVILALTGDEESGGAGIQSILKKHPEWVDAEIALNEGGQPANFVLNGPVQMVNMQLAEKTYQDFKITATGESGHSSVPKKDNAIYKMAKALQLLENHQPRAHFTDLTREYFRTRAQFEKLQANRQAMLTLANAKGPLPKKALEVALNDPYLTAILTTTCVATMTSAGTKVNALPAEAVGYVNCRILPDETPAQIQAWMQNLMGPSVKIEEVEKTSLSAPSPLTGAIPSAVKVVSAKLWPNVTVIPFMGRGATDSRYLREHGIHAYGLIPFPTIETDSSRSHGIDERIQVSAVPVGLQFLHELTLELAASPLANK